MQCGLTVNPNASIASVSGLTPMCKLAQATYTANAVILGGGVGSWSSDATSIASVNAASGLVTGVSNGTCNITYTITGGCGGTASASQQLTINPNASITGVTGTSPMCIGATATYSTNGVVLGGGTGAWSSTATGIATVNPSSGVVTGVSAGSCYIEYIIYGGCGGSPSAKQRLTINPFPSVTLSAAPSTICNGASSTLTAGGASSYSWSGGLGTGNPKTVSPTTTTVYTVTGTDGNTCSNTATRTITVNPLPTAEAGRDTTINLGDSILIGSAAIPGYVYSWYPGKGLSDSTIAQPWAKPFTTTIYYLTVTNNEGCSQMDKTTLTLPCIFCITDMTLDPYNPHCVDVCDDPTMCPPIVYNFITTCVGNDLNFNAGNFETDYVYSLGILPIGSSNCNNTMSFPYINGYDCSFPSPGNYWAVLIVTNNGNVIYSVQVEINVLDVPAPPNFYFSDAAGNQIDPAIICPNQQFYIDIPDFDYTLQYGISGTGVECYGVCNPLDPYCICNDQVGNYTETVTVTNYCGSSSMTLPYTISLQPYFNYKPVCVGYYTYFNGFVNCPNSTITSWSWNFGDGITGSGQDISHLYTSAGTYTVSLTVQDNINNWTTNQYNTSVYTQQITVFPLPPNPIISGDPTACSNNAIYTIVNFDNTSSYSWGFSLSSLTNLTSNVSTFSIDWTQQSVSGITTIFVTTTDVNGCTSIGTFVVGECCEPDPYIVDGNIYPNKPISPNNNFEIYASQLTPTELSYFTNPSLGNIIIDNDFVIDEDFNIGDQYSTITCSILFGPNVKIKLKPNKTLTIIKSTLQSGCNYMWYGIYVDNINEDVRVNNSTVRDAKNAVYSKNGGNYEITSSAFEDNYIGVLVSDYSPLIFPPQTPTPHPGSVTGTIFQTNTYLEPPYFGLKAQYGIKISEVNNITIGNPLESQNTFEDLFCGIKSYNSHVNIYNNQFMGITKTGYCNASLDPTQVMCETAIHASWKKYIASISILPDIVIGGSATNQSNSFTNCKNGIYIYNMQSTVISNTFTNIGYDAITCRDIRNNSVINNNTLSYISTGIKVLFTNPTVRNLDVSVNNITDPITGIFIVNASSSSSKLVTVGRNYISFSNYLNSIRNGINIQNCNGITVGWNAVERSITSTTLQPNEYSKLTGINVRSTQNAKINDNGFLRNLGNGIYTYGTLTSTQLWCNYFDGCYSGFYFGHASAISNQGSSTLNSANYWENDFNSNYNRRLNTNSGAMNLVYALNWYYDGNGSFNVNPNITSNNNCVTRIFPVANNSAIDKCVYFGGGGGNVPIQSPMNPSWRETEYGKIIRYELQFDSLATEYIKYGKAFAYNDFKNDTTIMYLDTADDYRYRQFYDSMKTTNTGKFADVITLADSITSKEALEASIINNTITTQDLIDENMKTVEDIYLNTFFADSIVIDSTQIPTLENIALQSPNKGGNGVYTARVILGIFPDDESNGQKVSNQAKDTKEPRNIKVYPNPAKDQVTFDVQLKNGEIGCIEIYSIIGQKLADHILVPQQNFIYNTSNLAEGVYLCRIKVNEMEIYSTKLIILK